MDILIFFEECIIKKRNSIQSDRILNMQVVFGHIHICVTNQALNCSQVNSQRLHLRNISVTAAKILHRPRARSDFSICHYTLAVLSAFG